MLPLFNSLQLAVTGTTATLRLDHGKANEMGSTELREIELLCAFLESGAVRTLITCSDRVSARGTHIFISGANVTERVGWPDERIKTHVRWQRDVLGRLRAAPVFHVAVVNGIALGWGTEFTLCCDYRIAGPNARFGLPETGLGILPGAGGSTELSNRIGVNQTLRLGMTGEQIGAAEALRIGLVDELADDPAAAMARAHALAALTASRSPTAVAAFKGAVLATLNESSLHREAIEAAAYEHCVDSGEAAIGRANFGAASPTVPWGPFRAWRP